MSQHILAHTKNLISDGEYQRAYKLLLTIKDDPTAQRWIEKLLQRAPELAQNSTDSDQPPESSVMSKDLQEEPMTSPTKGQLCWEYCALGPVTAMFNSTGDSIWYLTTHGVKKVKYKIKTSENSQDALARIVAELGQYGWEIAATGGIPGLSTTTNYHMIYFKRKINA